MAYTRILVGLTVILVAAGVAGGGCGRSSDVTGDASGGSTGTTVGVGGAGGDIVDFVPCAEVVEQASLVPVDMYILVDKSGSMDDTPMGAMNSKWVDASAAFTAFFRDPGADGLNVALRFWPDEMGVGTCDSVACDANACATPAVPLGALGPMTTPHEDALVAAFAATMPNGPTPMSAALQGGVQWAQAQLMAAPTHRVVVVLVTDGDPNGCDENVMNIAAIAGTGFAANVLTYAVGIQGSNQATMDQIAAQGGTTMGFYIGAGNAQQDLLNAMLTIAGQSVQCSFPVPMPANPAEVLDPRLVRVEYTPGGGTPGILPHVADASQCGAAGGWYYDNNAAPTTITLCSASCTTAQSDTLAQIHTALGCECEIDEDCPAGKICENHHCIDPCTDDSQCPAEHICLNGRCVPQEGDPCQTDAECLYGLVCIGGQCSRGGVVVGPFEAVQGGAFSCSAAPIPGSCGTPAPGSAPWWIAALVTLAPAFRRRRQTT